MHQALLLHQEWYMHQALLLHQARCYMHICKALFLLHKAPLLICIKQMILLPNDICIKHFCFRMIYASSTFRWFRMIYACFRTKHTFALRLCRTSDICIKHLCFRSTFDWLCIRTIYAPSTFICIKHTFASKHFWYMHKALLLSEWYMHQALLLPNDICIKHFCFRMIYA